jgi:hypothetical protein
MSLHLSRAIAVVMFATLTAVGCSPPLIRCETDANCTSDMKCDVRQGLCVDDGTYIEPTDGGPVNGGSIDNPFSGSVSGGGCSTAQTSPGCLSGHQPSGTNR